MVGVVGESGGRHDGAEQVESGRNLGVVECVDRWLVAIVLSRGTPLNDRCEKAGVYTWPDLPLDKGALMR